jgi:hypothetical protein
MLIYFPSEKTLIVVKNDTSFIVWKEYEKVLSSVVWMNLPKFNWLGQKLNLLKVSIPQLENLCTSIEKFYYNKEWTKHVQNRELKELNDKTSSITNSHEDDLKSLSVIKSDKHRLLKKKKIK